MLVDLKPTINQALRSNPALISLLGKDSNGTVKVYPQVAPSVTGPYVTYFEITNFDNRFASDRAISSEIHFQVDVWSQGATTAIAQAVNDTMENLGFYRLSAQDLYESDSKTYHKSLRYSKIHFGA
ncbi:DUF3168 domain-containing protein [Paenibacillus sp. SN-8-1]|uniref:DUF3168 domain-containing protein n=1 Tax=Paenibacillus sp. SN-8-1 TaxID=3435409 RepID=UPI003D9A5A69